MLAPLTLPDISAQARRLWRSLTPPPSILIQTTVQHEIAASDVLNTLACCTRVRSVASKTNKVNYLNVFDVQLQIIPCAINIERTEFSVVRYKYAARKTCNCTHS